MARSSSGASLRSIRPRSRRPSPPPLAGEPEGTVVRSIYDLKDDSLKQCFAVDEDRPKAVESKSGTGHSNSVFERVKE
jgi:hypothetical protein